MRILTVLITLFVLTGCGAEKAEDKQAQDAQPAVVTNKDEAVQPVKIEKVDPKTVTGLSEMEQLKPAGAEMYSGTVRFMDFEGGFWGIVTDSGEKILPQNLPADYQQDGLRLSFSAKPITDVMTIQQWGQLADVASIKVIGQVESKKRDPRL